MDLADGGVRALVDTNDDAERHGLACRRRLTLIRRAGGLKSSRQHPCTSGRDFKKPSAIKCAHGLVGTACKFSTRTVPSHRVSLLPSSCHRLLVTGSQWYTNFEVWWCGSVLP